MTQEEHGYGYQEEEEENYGQSFYSEISEEELESMKAARKERYLDQKVHYRMPKKQFSKKLMIFLIVMLFVYFAVFYVLKLTGVLTSLQSALCMLPGVAAVLIFYFVHRRKGE